MAVITQNVDDAETCMNGWYVTGLFDGEGCLSLSIAHRDKYGYRYQYWRLTASLVLREDDAALVQSIRDYFDCGGVYMSDKRTHTSQRQWHTSKRSDLIEKIIPHFEKYELQSKKKKEFILWKEAVYILNGAKRNKGAFAKILYTDEETNRLYEIRELLSRRHRSGNIQRALVTNQKLIGRTILLAA